MTFGASAIAGAAGAAAGLDMAATTSSFSTWPRLPLPLTLSGAMPFSTIILAAAGAGGGDAEIGAAGAALGAGAGLGASAGLEADTDAAAPSAMAPISAPTLTVSPGLA